MTDVQRLLVSMCGASGAGKSQLTKAVVALFGDEQAVRVPADYFIRPADGPLEDFLLKPIQYDWEALEETLSSPPGTTVSTPAFDFTRFRRTPCAHSRTFIIRPIMFVDAMYPAPFADVVIRVEAPNELRRERIATRDRAWGARVGDRWTQLEASRHQLEAKSPLYDLSIDGEQPLVVNAKHIAQLIAGRVPGGNHLLSE